MNMPAAMTSNRLALSPGISEPNSVRTPSTCGMPMALSRLGHFRGLAGQLALRRCEAERRFIGETDADEPVLLGPLERRGGKGQRCERHRAQAYCCQADEAAARRMVPIAHG
jgi:hypothetical protein